MSSEGGGGNVIAATTPCDALSCTDGTNLLDFSRICAAVSVPVVIQSSVAAADVGAPRAAEADPAATTGLLRTLLMREAVANEATTITNVNMQAHCIRSTFHSAVLASKVVGGTVADGVR